MRFFIDFLILNSFCNSPKCFEICQVFSFIQEYELLCLFLGIVELKFFICPFKKVGIKRNFIPADKIAVFAADDCFRNAGNSRSFFRCLRFTAIRFLIFLESDSCQMALEICSLVAPWSPASSRKAKSSRSGPHFLIVSCVSKAVGFFCQYG